MNSDTAVWRYLSLAALVATAGDRQLRLTRLDTFPDPFEGSVTKQDIDNQVPLFSGHQAAMMMMDAVSMHYPDMGRMHREREDPWTRMTRLRRAKTRSAHVSCWAAGNESEALWRLYCTQDGPQGVGVALRTTLSKLEASITGHDFYFSPVAYRHYHEGPAFAHELDSFFHKRLGFECEHEVRLLKFDEAQYHALINVPPSAPELPPFVYVDWSLRDFVEDIFLSPYADEKFEQQALAAIGAIDPALLGRVSLSVLNPRRYSPGF